jgi:hypothetical protein
VYTGVRIRDLYTCQPPTCTYRTGQDAATPAYSCSDASVKRRTLFLSGLDVGCCCSSHEACAVGYGCQMSSTSAADYMSCSS